MKPECPQCSTVLVLDIEGAYKCSVCQHTFHWAPDNPEAAAVEREVVYLKLLWLALVVGGLVIVALAFVRLPLMFSGAGIALCAAGYHIRRKLIPWKPTGPQIVKKRQLVGWFSVLELLGWGSVLMAVPLLNPVLFVVGLVLAFSGSTLSMRRICSECGNRVEATSKLCPTCRVSFQ